MTLRCPYNVDFFFTRLGLAKKKSLQCIGAFNAIRYQSLPLKSTIKGLKIKMKCFIINCLHFLIYFVTITFCIFEQKTKVVFDLL